MSKTTAQINEEAAKLVIMKPAVKPRSFFGDDNQAAVEAAIQTLAHRYTLEQIDARYGDNEYVKESAVHAHDWMNGLLAEDDAPSEAGWPMQEVVA